MKALLYKPLTFTYKYPFPFCPLDAKKDLKLDNNPGNLTEPDMSSQSTLSTLESLEDVLSSTLSPQVSDGDSEYSRESDKYFLNNWNAVHNSQKTKQTLRYI